uniref:SGS domain-containing protein n=1 Tax=Meloidogyne enterolobii TaxID=390850 RepID=A0A6V7U3E7_MELEN|nr:unnamed protein product [Meloidogyne enterolobii]
MNNDNKEQQDNSKPSLPTSSGPSDLSAKYAKWDKLAKEVDENDEAEDSVDKLFQKIYQDASDDTKKAMIKSFTESKGTVLSTNWSEVKKAQVEMKPPKGSEFKPYEK